MERKRKELLDLLAARGRGCSHADDRPAAERLQDVARRAGGVNRLTVLLRFHKDLRQRNLRRLDPSDN